MTLAEGPSSLDRDELFALLTDSSAAEWKDKVGVAGNTEGSAKTTTRLLEARGWVFKTDLATPSPDLASARASANAAAAQAREVPVWHPRKMWLVLEAEDLILVVTVCPRLRVLRQVPSFEERVRLWGRMLAWALDVSREHGVGFDMHPSNFGTRGEDLYYLDDEFYDVAGLWDVGSAIAGRIPEEEVDEGGWEWAANELKGALGLHVKTATDWSELEAGLLDRPLVSRFVPMREVVRRGLRRIVEGRRRKKRGTPERLCVLADVHANLPALEAVLEEAETLAPDGYLLLGDVVGYGPHPRECIARLAEIDGLTSVRGNHDQVAVMRRADDGMNRMARFVAEWTSAQLGESERAWLEAMPRELGGEGWLAVHGAPRDPQRFYAYVYELTFRENLQVLREQELELCFYGHTHVPFVHRRRAEEDPEKLGATNVQTGEPATQLLVNPGSVGQPRDGDTRASFALWDRKAKSVSFHRVEYPIEATIRDIERAGFPRDLAYRLETGR